MYVPAFTHTHTIKCMSGIKDNRSINMITYLAVTCAYKELSKWVVEINDWTKNCYQCVLSLEQRQEIP